MHIVDEPRKFSPSNVLMYTVVSGARPSANHHLILIVLYGVYTIYVVFKEVNSPVTLFYKSSKQ